MMNESKQQTSNMKEDSKNEKKLQIRCNNNNNDDHDDDDHKDKRQTICNNNNNDDDGVGHYEK